METLEYYSNVSLFSAVAIYAIAFVFYAIDLANRSAAEDGQQHNKTRMERVAFGLTVVGFLFHAAATVLRGVGAGRVPWVNMYEFSLTATLAIVLVFLIVQFFIDLRFLGTLVTGIVVLFLMITRINYYVPIVPLPDVLNSYWLIIHILVAVLAVGFFTISLGLSILQLLQARRVSKKSAGMRWLKTFPDQVRLDNLAYRMAIIGFVFWTFTLIAGSVWAEASWGRYWGWDTKEVWTFVIWVLYAGYIHAHATRGWRGTRSSWLNIVSYAGVLFNFGIVNVFFDGLHSYSGL